MLYAQGRRIGNKSVGGGGLRLLIMYCDNNYAVDISPQAVWGYASPENFGNLDSLRVFLRHSGGYFGADLVAIFT